MTRRMTCWCACIAQARVVSGGYRAGARPIGLEADFQALPPGEVSLQDEHADFAMRHKLDTSRAYILQVGTRNRYKNTPVVLEVLAQLKKVVPNAALLRVGADIFDDEKNIKLILNSFEMLKNDNKKLSSAISDLNLKIEENNFSQDAQHPK